MSISWQKLLSPLGVTGTSTLRRWDPYCAISLQLAVESVSPVTIAVASRPSSSTSSVIIVMLGPPGDGVGRALTASPEAVGDAGELTDACPGVAGAESARPGVSVFGPGAQPTRSIPRTTKYALTPITTLREVTRFRLVLRSRGRWIDEMSLGELQDNDVWIVLSGKFTVTRPFAVVHIGVGDLPRWRIGLVPVRR